MSAATIVTSIVTGGSNNAATTSEQANAYATDFVSQGVVGAISNASGAAPSTGAYAVNQNTGSDMAVAVSPGVAYIPATPTSQNSQVMRAKMTATSTAYAINSNSSGSTKFDWIYLQVNATNAANPAVGSDNVTALFTSRSTSVSTDTGSPPTYGTLLAVVTVANGATAIINANISDRRTAVTLSNGNQNTTTGWNILNYPLTYSANNGNKEFTVTTPNDLTGILNAGMPLKIARSITPPTQCMSFTAASSQYATKASPSGISFTGAFTISDWIYVNSYTGNTQALANRFSSGSGGFGLELDSSGRLRVYYGSGASYTDFISYESIPLKQWVHVAGVVTSVGSKTGVLYKNGTVIPSFSALTAATTLAQASTDLRIGANAASPANTYFDGYMSEVRIFSASRTQANIQSDMATSLVGSESNLVALYGGNGVWTDATSNANTLTASGGASNTQAANPYNATEYAYITKVSYSNPTTTITLFAGVDSTIPNMTLNSPYYASTRYPFGFPASRGRWRTTALIRTECVQSSPSAGTWYNLTPTSGVAGGQVLTIPTGDWLYGYETDIYSGRAGSSNGLGCRATLSTANNTESDTDLTSRVYTAVNSAVDSAVAGFVTRRKPLSLAAITPYYLNYSTPTASAANIKSNPDTLGGDTKIFAECAYA